MLETVSNRKSTASNHTNSKLNKNGGDVVDLDDDDNMKTANELVDKIESDLEIAKVIAYEIEERKRLREDLTSHHRKLKHHNSRDNPETFLRRRDPIVDGGGSLTNCRYQVEVYHKTLHYMGITFHQRLTRLVRRCDVL